MLKYHQLRAKLGMGDLHPGGVAATTTLLDLLAQRKVRRVLEIGAGIGNTSARMAALGWNVTALEPDPVLFGELGRRAGLFPRCESFFDHAATAPYDAIIAESVLFQMDLASAFAHARTLLKPGGYLGFIEAVWSAGTTSQRSQELHDETLRQFGIAVGSREPLAWSDWSRNLTAAGFEAVHAELLPRGSAGHPPSANSPGSPLLAALRDPRLPLWMVRYRFRKRAVAMTSGAQESWLYLGQSPSALAAR